jgi:protein TonB
VPEEGTRSLAAASQQPAPAPKPAPARDTLLVPSRGTHDPGPAGGARAEPEREGSTSTPSAGPASERVGPGGGAGTPSAAGAGGGGTGSAGAPAPGGGQTAAIGGPRAEGGTEYAGYLAGLRRRVQASLRYPPAARRRGLEGTVHVEIVITPAGAVGPIAVVRSSSHALLDDAAIEAVRSLPAQPFPRQLVPRTLRVRLPVVFQLR